MFLERKCLLGGKTEFGLNRNRFRKSYKTVVIPKPNFKRSDGCDAIFRSKATEHPLKMSGKVREGNRRGFLAIVRASIQN